MRRRRSRRRALASARAGVRSRAARGSAIPLTRPRKIGSHRTHFSAGSASRCVHRAHTSARILEGSARTTPGTREAPSACSRGVELLRDHVCRCGVQLQGARPSKAAAAREHRDDRHGRPARSPEPKVEGAGLYAGIGDYVKVEPKRARRRPCETAEGGYARVQGAPRSSTPSRGSPASFFADAYPYQLAVTSSARVTVHARNRENSTGCSPGSDIAYSGRRGAPWSSAARLGSSALRRRLWVHP